MNIPFSPPDICEKEINEVVDTLKSGWITTGPKTKKLEKDIASYCNVKKAVCLNSATASLELTLRVLGIGKGDEVIVPAYTYTASVSPIIHVGAKPVLIDIQKDCLEMDYDKLKEAITDKTKAIIPVDIAGILCDYDIIYNIIREKQNIFKPTPNSLQEKFNRIVIIADCAHGIGAQRNGKMAGEIADFTTFSFHAVKNLTTAEGGAVVWKDVNGIDNEELYKEYQLLSLHGQTKDALHKNQIGAWEYDIITPAYKCNMTDINAALGLAQLSRYPQLLKRRHEIIMEYNKAFENEKIQILPHVTRNAISSGHLYIVRVKDISEEKRNEIIIKMGEKGISCNVHYKPIPMLTAYKNLGFDIKEYPNAYDFYHNEITLPLYSILTDEQVRYIIESFKEILKETI